MRMLGLDIGERRIGVAISDPSGTVATPLDVLDARLAGKDPTPLRRIIEDYEVEQLVVGLPLTMAGEEGPQALRVRGVAASLATTLDLPAVLWDERLSSREVERVMAHAGRDSKQRRGRVDMAAATLILQAYLDAHRETVDHEDADV